MGILFQRNPWLKWQVDRVQHAQRAYSLVAPSVNGSLAQPFGSAIYFAIDLDPANPKSGISEQVALNGIQQYFKGVNAFFSSLPTGQSYAVGVYGAADTVSQIMGSGLATYSWLASSFPDKQGLFNTNSWNLSQPDVHVSGNVVTIPGTSIKVDKDYANAFKGSFGGWDPPTSPSVTSSIPNTSLLVQAMASFGVNDSVTSNLSLSTEGVPDNHTLFAANHH